MTYNVSEEDWAIASRVLREVGKPEQADELEALQKTDEERDEVYNFFFCKLADWEFDKDIKLEDKAKTLTDGIMKLMQTKEVYACWDEVPEGILVLDKDNDLWVKVGGKNYCQNAGGTKMLYTHGDDCDTAEFAPFKWIRELDLPLDDV